MSSVNIAFLSPSDFSFESPSPFRIGSMSSTPPSPP